MRSVARASVKARRDGFNDWRKLHIVAFIVFDAFMVFNAFTVFDAFIVFGRMWQ